MSAKSWKVYWSHYIKHTDAWVGIILMPSIYLCFLVKKKFFIFVKRSIKLSSKCSSNNAKSTVNNLQQSMTCQKCDDRENAITIFHNDVNLNI